MAVVKRKRIRYKIPCYKKIYSVYQYDQKKYHKIYKKIQQLAIKYNESIFYNTNPYRVLSLCYVKDEENQRKHLGDIKHIFRYKTLENIFKEIANYILITYEILPDNDVLKYLFKRTHIVVYAENGNCQAELFETFDKSLTTRLKVHIEILRNLQKGIEIEKAVFNAVLKYNNRLEVCHN